MQKHNPMWSILFLGVFDLLKFSQSLIFQILTHSIDTIFEIFGSRNHGKRFNLSNF